MRLAHTLTLLAAALAAQSALAQGRPDLVDQSLRSRGIEYVPNELLVQFKPNASPEAQRAAVAYVRGTQKETVLPASRRTDGKGELVLMTLPAGLAVADAFRAMSQLADVDFAEPNWIYRHQLDSTDPYATNGSLWGMASPTAKAGVPANEFGIGASTVWANSLPGTGDKTDCSKVWVGIIDEGYKYTHADLSANAGVNQKEKAGNSTDDDLNGYIDDIYGWDFDGNNNTVYDGASDDHGTHVAGTIGGTGGNGKGVAGVCWRVNLISAKFLGKNGGTTANAIRAVNYITDFKQKQGVNLVASNNSWGGGGFSQGLLDAIMRANAANILFIAAAGNNSSNNDTTANYPSNYGDPNLKDALGNSITAPNVMAVASITSTGGISSFSNFGARTVHLGAPGSGIWSTVPSKSGADSYASYSGTSMATPHVTGAAALFAAQNPTASAAQIKAAILGSVTATPSLSGKTITGGRLNVSGF